MSSNTFIRPGIDFEAFNAFLDQVRERMEARRREGLAAHAAATGLPLPMAPEVILSFEDAGAVVDLETGWITWPSGIRTAVVPAESVQVAATEVPVAATEKA
jgi:hypothetical protein